MLTNLVKFEHAAEGKVCQFICNHDTDVRIARDALYKFLGYLQQIEEANRKALEEKDALEKEKMPELDLPTTDEVKQN